MMKHPYDYTFVQDGSKLKQSIQDKFNRQFEVRDLSHYADGHYINFVGFIFAEKEALISFPKRFFTERELSSLNKKNHRKEQEKYVRQLFELLQKIIVSRSKRLFQVKKELDHSYPFTAFLSVYEYYQKYGLFTKEREVKKFGHDGKILWKDTIKHSPLIVKENNLLYWPPVVKKYSSDYAFLSKCMAYVINTTIDRFPFLFNFERIQLEYRDINFVNSNAMIQQLNKIRQHTFKDIDLKLIDQLILFFKQTSYQGQIKNIKIYSFYLIWEELVDVYLNKYFVKIDHKNDFIYSKKGNQTNNFTKKIYPIDARHHMKDIKTYKIIPDFIYEDEHNRYIFDAKYYTTINEMDYKQVSYYFLLRYYENKDRKKVKNALFLPTAKASRKKIHFMLNEEFSADGSSFIIFEYYINVKKLIDKYLW